MNERRAICLLNTDKLHFDQIRLWIEWKLIAIGGDACIQIGEVNTNDVWLFDCFDIIGRQISYLRLNDQVRGGCQNIFLGAQVLAVIRMGTFESTLCLRSHNCLRILTFCCRPRPCRVRPRWDCACFDLCLCERLLSYHGKLQCQQSPCAHACDEQPWRMVLRHQSMWADSWPLSDFPIQIILPANERGNGFSSMVL